MSRGHAVAALVLVCVAAAAPAGADESPFVMARLAAPGRVRGVHVEDLDGDGRADLAAVCLRGRPPASARVVAIWFAARDGFRAAPDQVLDVPAGAAAIDFAPLGERTRPLALLLYDAAGVTAHVLSAKTDGRPPRYATTAAPLVASTGLLALPDPDDLPFVDLARDWDGDGRAELLLPRLDGVAVFEWTAPAPAGDGGAPPAPRLVQTALLAVQPRASYLVRAEQDEPRLRNFTVRAFFALPELIPGEWDGDGRPDLFVLLDDLVQVHRAARPGAGVFQAQPAARHALVIKSDAEVKKDSAHVQVALADVDRDGIIDLVVSKVSGGLGQMRTETGLYLGKRGGGYQAPGPPLVTQGYAGAMQLADLDGDGRPELVSPRVSVGLGEMARALLTKKMRVTWEVRRNLGRGFSIDAVAKREIDFPVDFSQMADVEGPFPSVAGDFDGDRRADLVAAHAPDAMAVWRGDARKLLLDKPAAIVRVTPTKHFRVVDLDGDRKADLVLFYPTSDPLTATIVVLTNRGVGW